MKKNIIAIIGGCGHIGFPLALKFAEKNFTYLKQEGSKLWEDYNIMIV